MVRTPIYVVLLACLTGCSPKPHITLGSKNFTEQVILGELIAQQIERRTGVTADRRLNLGGTLLAHESLKNGSIDLYPEYTGTALTAILVGILLVFATKGFFTNSHQGLDDLFNTSVNRILR